MLEVTLGATFTFPNTLMSKAFKSFFKAFNLESRLNHKNYETYNSITTNYACL